MLLSPVDVLTCLVYQNVPLPVRLSPNPGTSVWLRTLAVRKYIPSALVLKPADNSSDTPTCYCQSPAAKVSQVQGPDERASAGHLLLPMWQVSCCSGCFQLFSFGSRIILGSGFGTLSALARDEANLVGLFLLHFQRGRKHLPYIGRDGREHPPYIGGMSRLQNQVILLCFTKVTLLFSFGSWGKWLSSGRHTLRDSSPLIGTCRFLTPPPSPFSATEFHSCFFHCYFISFLPSQFRMQMWNVHRCSRSRETRMILLYSRDITPKPPQQPDHYTNEESGSTLNQT